MWGGLTSLQRCSQHVLQLQLNGLGLEGLKHDDKDAEINDYGSISA